MSYDVDTKKSDWIWGVIVPYLGYVAYSLYTNTENHVRKVIRADIYKKIDEECLARGKIQEALNQGNLVEDMLQKYREKTLGPSLAKRLITRDLHSSDIFPLIGRAIGIGLWALYDPIEQHLDAIPLVGAWLLVNARPIEFKHPGHFLRSAEYKDELNKTLGYRTEFQTEKAGQPESPSQRKKEFFIDKKEKVGDLKGKKGFVSIGNRVIGKKEIHYVAIQCLGEENDPPSTGTGGVRETAPTATPAAIPEIVTTPDGKKALSFRTAEESLATYLQNKAVFDEDNTGLKLSEASTDAILNEKIWSEKVGDFFAPLRSFTDFLMLTTPVPASGQFAPLNPRSSSVPSRIFQPLMKPLRVGVR